MAFQQLIQASGVTTGTTAVTVVPAPSDSWFSHRLVSLVVSNRDSANALVIVNVDDNTTSREVRRETLLAGVSATGVLTFSGQITSTKVCVIGGKTYTWEAALSDVDGHVDVGATQAISEANLTNAINLGAGAGSAYATSTTAHPSVTAVDSGSTVVATALTAGAAGNVIATTEDDGQTAWGAVTLTGGVDSDELELTAPILFDATDQSLEIVLGWDVIGTELDYVVSYIKERRLTN